MLTFWKLNFLDSGKKLKKKTQKNNGFIFYLTFDVEILSHKVLEHLAKRLLFYLLQPSI